LNPQQKILKNADFITWTDMFLVLSPLQRVRVYYRTVENV